MKTLFLWLALFSLAACGGKASPEGGAAKTPKPEPKPALKPVPKPSLPQPVVDLVKPCAPNKVATGFQGYCVTNARSALKIAVSGKELPLALDATRSFSGLGDPDPF